MLLHKYGGMWTGLSRVEQPRAGGYYAAMAVRIRRLRKADIATIFDINALLMQLWKEPSKDKGSVSELRTILNDKNTILIVAQDGKRIVGMGTLYIVVRIGKRSGHIEDVVVDSAYRGQGLGSKIMRSLITAARAKKVTALHLTSRPARVAGNKLYQKLGFEKKETNVYRLKL